MSLARFIRLASILIFTILFSACANLEAVRNFSVSSAKLTAYKDVTQRYLTSPDRIRKEIPIGSDFDEDRKRVDQIAVLIESDKDSILKLHNVATGYMAALATLSGEDSFNISEDIDKVTGAIAESPTLGLNADHVKAYGSIASTVTSWILTAVQAKEVKSMVSKYGDDMDTLLEGLLVASEAMKVRLASEQGRMKSYQDVLEAPFQIDIGPEKPPPTNLTGETLANYNSDRNNLIQRKQAILKWSNRGFTALDTDEQNAVKSANEAIAGIILVRKGHDEMRKNINNLSKEDVTKLLNKVASDLKNIRDNLKKL